MLESDLKKNILEGLNSYHDLSALASSPLNELRVASLHRPHVRPTSLNSDEVAGLTIRRVLDAGMRELEQLQPAATALLRERFHRARHARLISDEREIGISTVYEHQNRAIAALSGIIGEMEAQAQDAKGARKRCLAASLPDPAYIEFVGQEPLFAEIGEALNPGASFPARPIAITGLGGLGKTSTAREAILRCVIEQNPEFERMLWAVVAQPLSFPTITADRQRYTLENVLTQLGDQINEPLSVLPNNERRLQALARRLEREPCLVVIDNIETAEEVSLALIIARALSPVAQLLLTSRHRIDSPALRSFALRELNWNEALRLLLVEAKRLSISSVDENTARTIWQEVGGNPLALKLVVSQLAILPISQVLRTLKEPTGAAQNLYEHIYDTSWGLLSPQAQEILLGLVLLPPAGATWDGMRLAAGLEGAQESDRLLLSAIQELTALSLLQVTPALDPVYSLHRLTYRYLEYKWSLEGGGSADGS